MQENVVNDQAVRLHRDKTLNELFLESITAGFIKKRMAEMHFVRMSVTDIEKWLPVVGC